MLSSKNFFIVLVFFIDWEFWEFWEFWEDSEFFLFLASCSQLFAY